MAGLSSGCSAMRSNCWQMCQGASDPSRKEQSVSAQTPPAAVHASWGWESDVSGLHAPGLWQRANEMVQAGILLGFDPARFTLTFPEYLRNVYHSTVLRWVIDGAGPRP